MAVLVTAAVAVSMAGAAEWVTERWGERAVPVTADAFTIVVDAGHGGFDGGATGTDSGVHEAGLNLAVAEQAAQGLRNAGLTVRMTRESEGALGATKAVDMAARKRIFSGGDVDLVVSIHMNHFSDRAVSGPMAYYMQGSKEGQKLAQQVIDSLTDAAGRSRRLANPGDYFVIRECACPAVLVECGFLSNSTDEQALQDPAHQAALAQAIVKGILSYLEEA